MAGFFAAVAAARKGAKTLVVERFNSLGGTAANGTMGLGYDSGKNGGIFKELLENMKQMTGRAGNFDPELIKYATLLMAESSGVEILLDAFIESAVCENKNIEGVTVFAKGGKLLLKAKVIIDATGDADVAASAGVPFEKGGIDGRMQAITLRSRIAGVKNIKVDDWSKITDILEGERKKGRVNIPDYIVKFIDVGAESAYGLRTFNQDMVAGIDATDPWQLSRAEIEARKRVWELVAFARKYFPGWGNCYLLETASLLGIRETRRISGEYALTRDDVLTGRKFQDGISRASHFLDLHDPEGFSVEPGNFVQYMKTLSCPEGDWYEIPYRCLVPQKIDALLIAGRCVSSDREANGSLRLMPTCASMGQAAGTAAALSVKENTVPRKIDGSRLRALLIKDGMNL